MHKLRVLLADDMAHVRSLTEHRIAQVTRHAFKAEITQAECAEDAIETARRGLNNGGYDLILLDINYDSSERSQGANGHQAASEIRKIYPQACIALVSALGNDENLSLAESNEAVDLFFRRTAFTNEELERLCLWALLTRLHQDGAMVPEEKTLFTASPLMQNFLRQLDRIRHDKNLVIYGDTGTGKESSAYRVYANGSLKLGVKERPYFAVNCAAIPENLLEPTLFGHVRGAFTGAYADSEGYLDKARGGVLVLDEVQNSSQAFQRTLMRVFQEKKFSPVGSGRVQSFENTQIIALMNMDPEDEKAKGKLMPDFLARLQQQYITIPSLKERPEDIALLAKLLLKRNGLGDKEFSRDALEFLQTLPWDENIRGLDKVTLATQSCKLPIVTADWLKKQKIIEDMLRPKFCPPAESAAAGVFAVQSEANLTEVVAKLDRPLTEIVGEIEKNYLLRLWSEEPNLSRLARKSGLDRSKLRRKLMAYGIIVPSVG